MIGSVKPRDQRQYKPEEEFEIELDSDRFDLVSVEEGRELLDRQARQYLNMSGEEFRRQYHAGIIKDSDGPEVFRISFLLPFGEDDENGEEAHTR